MNQINHIVYADDDDDDIIFFREAMLSICPAIQLTTATNGRHLFKVLEQSPIPDLILLDLNMPVLNGYECLVALRSQQTYAEVPIIVYTTSENKMELIKCIKAGATSYIVKPESYTKLQSLIKNLHAGIYKLGD